MDMAEDLELRRRRKEWGRTARFQNGHFVVCMKFWEVALANEEEIL